MNRNEYHVPAATAAQDEVPERFAAPAITTEIEVLGTGGLTLAEIRRIVLDTVG